MGTESSAEQELSVDIRSILAAVWARRLRIALVVVLLLGGTYGLVSLLPRVYESTSGILVEPRNNAYTRAVNGIEPGGSVSDETLMSSQIELIKSRGTLMAVVESLDLANVPEFGDTSGSPMARLMQLFGRQAPNASPEAALATLESQLTIMQERTSRLISISARSVDPELAARIANAIAEAHVQRRSDFTLSDTAEASAWLEAEIEKLRVRVAEAEAKVAEFRVQNDLFAGAGNTTLLDQQLSTIAAQINAAQERKNNATSRANLIQGMIASGQPIDGILDGQESAVVQQLAQERARLQGERAQMLATMLPNHPSVRAVTAQVTEIERQMAAEGQRVADALVAAANIEGALVVSLQGDLARVKAGVSTATQESVTLNELEREAKAERDLLESYLARYREATSRTDASADLPDVRIITVATPGQSPVSPKTALILLAVGVVSLSVQIGWVVFAELLSGRAVVERRDRYAQAFSGEARPAAEAEPAKAPEFAPPPSEADADAESGARGEDATLAEFAALEAELKPLVADEVDDGFLSEGHADGPAAEDDAPVLHVNAAEPRRSGTTAVASLSLDELSDRIATGTVRVVMLADLAHPQVGEEAAERLVEDALALGLSVALVDAGSRRVSREPGLTDLAAEHASFGDVVHRSTRDGLAEVPWGHLPVLNRRSQRPFTLLEALSDIYEVVIVRTGPVGMGSALPVFAGGDCLLVLVAETAVDPALIGEIEADAAALGYAELLLVRPAPKAEVA